MLSMSAGESWTTRLFSRILCGLTDFGKTEQPSYSGQSPVCHGKRIGLAESCRLMRTLAGERPYFSLIFLTALFFRIGDSASRSANEGLVLPSGE